MSKVNAWSNIIKQNIEKQSDQIFKRDYKFYKIDRLEKIAERIDEYSDTCEICQSFKPEVENISEHTAELINGSPSERSQYEKRNGVLVKHLKDIHHLVHKEYYASVYSLAGFAGGSVIFGGIAFFIDIKYFIFGLLLGFTIGIIIGRVYGRKKDKEKERNGLIL